MADTARAALAVAANVASFRHDLLGRIFHTVLDTARYDGSFYTTTPAATLLASLAIREDTCDWEDIEAVERLRITDPACGTGTLLMAAAERIRELAPHFRDQGEPARILIENVLTGYDINLTATHMAATTLGLLSPSTQFQKMKIYRALLGIDESGNARLGSLELLDRDPMLMTWPNPTQPVQQIDSGEALGPDLREPSDLVIMNPPFTRDSLRHDQFDQNDEKQLKAREKDLFADTPVHLSSNGNSFMVLADFINRSESGSIASVLPLVTATNASSLKIRQFLASNYHIETIVTSYDPERVYFSESTGIGEMLLVCRKWRDRDKGKPPTKVVNLSINPSTPADALNVAKSIENDTVESQNFGTVQEVPASTITDGDWGAVQFLSPYLRQRFIALRDGDMFSVIKLGRIADIGPDGRGIRGNFIRSSMPGEKGMTALWDHKTDITQSMAANTDCHIHPKSGKEMQCDHLWSQRGRLLLPTRVALKTVRMFSVRLEVSALGSGWVPCKPRASGVADEVMEKSICVYLNSALGVLAVLGNRSSKLLSYPQLSMDDLRKLAVPDFSALGDETVMKLAQTYDVLATHKLKPLPEMQSDDVRHALDHAICDALGVDPEEVGMIRNSLTLEPSVTGKRYEVKTRVRR